MILLTNTAYPGQLMGEVIIRQSVTWKTHYTAHRMQTLIYLAGWNAKYSIYCIEIEDYLMSLSWDCQQSWKS